MLPKAHLTSHSRMSGSGWVITLSWLFESWRSFLYSSSVYSCHLFLISSASVMSTPFLSFIESIFAWNVPLVSLIFLKWSLVFPILLFSFLSLHWSLRKAFLPLLAILWNSAFKWVYLSFSPLFFASLLFFSCFFFSFIFIGWRLINPQYCSRFCHTLAWISYGFTCIPHPDPPSHLPLYPIPLGLPNAPGPSTCLIHPTWLVICFTIDNIRVLMLFSRNIPPSPYPTESKSLFCTSVSLFLSCI